MKLKSAKNIQLTKRFVLPITTKEKIIDLVMQGFLEISGMVFISKLLSCMYVADLVIFYRVSHSEMNDSKWLEWIERLRIF